MKAPKILAASVALTIVASLGLTACGTTTAGADASGVTTLRYQGWTDQVTLPELAENLGYFDGKVTLDWVGNTISGPQDIQSAATGQTDFGGAFAGAVAKLATAGAPITGVINYYGTDEKTFAGFYVLNDSPITKPADLVGKKVGVNTLGGNNEADIHDQLIKDGLSEEDVEKVQLVALPPTNTEDALRKGQIDVATLTGQFQQRAAAVGGVRTVFTDYEEYGAYNGGQYVFRNDFLATNPAAATAFTTGVGRAIEWERTTPHDQVIAKFTQIINDRHRPNETTQTVKYWLSVAVPTPFGKVDDADFTRWEGWLRGTGAISSPLEPQKFYTNKYNAAANQTTGK